MTSNGKSSTGCPVIANDFLIASGARFLQPVNQRALSRALNGVAAPDASRSESSGMGTIMKKRSSLERKMLSYFGLIAAASLLITVEFVLAIRQAAIHANALQAGSTLFYVLESLRNKALLMCVVQAVVTLIVLVMFIRRITGPLQSMVEQAEIISQGDLSQTIRVPGKDEIALLAETINGLTSNIQEIVGLSLSTDMAVREIVADLSGKLQEQPEAKQQIGEIEAKLDQLRGFMEEFKLLPPPMAAAREE